MEYDQQYTEIEILRETEMNDMRAYVDTYFNNENQQRNEQYNYFEQMINESVALLENKVKESDEQRILDMK